MGSAAGQVDSVRMELNYGAPSLRFRELFLVVVGTLHVAFGPRNPQIYTDTYAYIHKSMKPQMHRLSLSHTHPHHPLFSTRWDSAANHFQSKMHNPMEMTLIRQRSKGQHVIFLILAKEDTQNKENKLKGSFPCFQLLLDPT